ncbi:trna 5-methylaminomethyl-2-thiouridylate -methyltransferase [Holotrichia oblita]|nr:trna 5-methylaminomethyl-2-thiouridylate -methyltransferase [Holotrichia oblita]
MFAKYGFEKLNCKTPPTVVVGMSGGVDSSVAAAILKWQGYNVIGLFMKNWDEQDAGGVCTSEADFADVKRVSEALEIPYYTVNFSKQYMDNVFKMFLDGLERGVTPNPDVLCNREIKFGPFLDYATKIGADYIATGHYCRVNNGILMKGSDESKDQSYFLCGLSQKQLSRVLFPVGGLLKEQVREIAAKLNLVTAQKKDSTGICFIGERKFRDFMKGYLGNKPGEIRTLDGKTVGKHDGLMYYTLGQRKGLGIGGMKGTDENRWFVVSKDLQNNILYVNNGECPEMFTEQLTARDFNWIVKPNEKKFKCTAKTRYRQPDQKCEAEVLEKDLLRVKFDKPQRAVTPGQWVVLYDGDKCLGGGEII